VSAPDPVRRLAPVGSGDERRVELIPALAATSRIARHHGISAHVRAALDSYELRLPGIGGRYLAGVAAHVAGQGWTAAEAAALLGALEDRCSMWVVSSCGAALITAGLAPDGARARRAAAARFAAGRWGPARIPAAGAVSDPCEPGLRAGPCARRPSRAGGRRPDSCARRRKAAPTPHQWNRGWRPRSARAGRSSCWWLR